MHVEMNADTGTGLLSPDFELAKPRTAIGALPCENSGACMN
jgi:hypothetical protein